MKVRIFTDGACSENPGPGGWAAVFNAANSCRTISGNERLTTNNRMELKAVVEVFKKIVRMEIHKPKNAHHEYDIFSDSAYVVNTINNNWLDVWQKNNWQTTKHEDVKNKDLWEEFNKLKHKADEIGICITINKIKGHSGNTFNELVDKLAREESIKAKEGVWDD
jgi:ribonuclease HI